jgi:hypothetical protein
MTGALRGALPWARPRSEIARSSFAIVVGTFAGPPDYHRNAMTITIKSAAII